MELERRIALFTSVLVLGLLVCICVTVGGTILRSEEARMARALKAEGKLYSEFESERFQALAVETKLLADLPQLRAVMATRDAASITDTLGGFRDLIHADFLVAYDEKKNSYDPKNRGTGLSLAERAHESGKPVAGYVLDGTTLRQALAVSVRNGAQELGTLVAGYSFGDEVLARLQAMTGGEFAVVAGSEARVLLATPAAKDWLARDGARLATATNEPSSQGEFMVTVNPLGRESGARLVSLKGLGEGLQIARKLRTNVILLSFLFCFLGIAVSLLFARSISRPLRELSQRLAAVDPADPATLAQVSASPEALGADRDVKSLLESFGQLAGALSSSRSRESDGAVVRTSALEAELAAATGRAEKLAQANRRLLKLVSEAAKDRRAA